MAVQSKAIVLHVDEAHHTTGAVPTPHRSSAFPLRGT